MYRKHHFSIHITHDMYRKYTSSINTKAVTNDTHTNTRGQTRFSYP